ncbi:hypothetical protein NKJ55_31085 [Mesorhizobium sp. M0106]|uniref:hypothetical protein n=1 Tax=unclassified Mesorhizobium TaxID=325217 RepID=UPI00333DE1D0
MTISLTRLMSAIKEPNIAKFWIAYFRENFRGEINDQLLEAFHESDITKADIARKLDKRPEQITRWLSAPCNLESDTISDIALSLGYVPKIRFEKIGAEQSNNRTHAFLARYEATTSRREISAPMQKTSTQVREMTVAY